MSESEANLQLEIGYVLFLDIVGYSKLLIEEQKERLDQLTRIVLETSQVRDSTDEQLVRLPTGDGMALVFHHSAEEPARCALEIAEALRKHPEIPVRMGIHSGPVSQVTDVSGRHNIAGAGINMAQRVMDCGDAGHILVSQHVADDLRQYRQWAPRLHDLGETEVKHGVRLHLFNLSTKELGNGDVPEKFRRAKETPAVPSPETTARGSRALTAALIILGVITAAAAFYFVSHRRATKSSAAVSATAAPGVPEKSIAVLPFENLSSDKENGYFADGVQDEILTDLAKVADLKVISRTSVIGYRDTAGRNLRKIGQELRVAAVVEGSVQRAGGRVRVNAQLVDARTDAHLWAQTYDRELSDVFAVQSEIAKAIADQLQVKLSPNEKAAIEQVPTRNIAAFDFYTRARILMLNVSFTALRMDNLRQAVDLLNQAIAQDANFSQAYSSLAEANDQLYGLGGGDHTPSRLALAEKAIARLRELQPEAGETYLAIARHRYYAFRDYAGARAALTEAAKSLPNEPTLLSLAGFIDRRAGNWNDSLRELNEAIDHDPRNVFFMQQISLSYQYLRRYAEMAAVLDRALSVDPARLETKIARAQVQLHWRADTHPLHDVIQNAVTRAPDSAGVVAENWVNLSLVERDPEGLERARAALKGRRFGENAITFDPNFGEALLTYLRGDSLGFKEVLKIARAKQVESLRQQPEYSAPICSLAIINAMLGNKEQALQEGRRALELTPVTKDALAGSELVVFFAVVCAWAGEKDLAFEQLSVATTNPCFLSYGQLKLQPYWDPLRGDPRFEEIVASLAPKDAN